MGLYQTSTNTVNNQTTYFFRGHVINNYVSFANTLWRIVRINEDGSIRMIKQTGAVTAEFNSAYNDAMYVGYMYGTSSNPYENTNSSIAKTKIEEYYDSSLASYSSYLAPIEFCNDREIFSSSPYIKYAGFQRLRTESSPIFTCPNESRDLFTLTTSTRGNKKLTKSIGLLTMDEVLYAGTPVYQVGRDNYLNDSPNVFIYTSTPAYFYNSLAGILALYNRYGSNNVANGSSPLRPVISLKADTIVLGGTGSADDPYIITE